MRLFKLFFLFVLFTLPSLSFCQEWIKTFDIQNNTCSRQLQESYDGGILIGAAIGVGNTYKIGWLIKTDVNGNTLWEKKLGNGSKMWSIHGLDVALDGGIILVGTCDTLGEDWDPFVIKLNPCGQIDWCKIFRTENQSDYGRKILSLADGSYIMQIHSLGNGTVGQFIQLNHIDSIGEIIWEQIYFPEDSLGSSFLEYGLTLTPDDKILISGICYHTIYAQSSPQWVWPLLIMADLTGESEWELPWGYTLPFPVQVGGEGFQSVQIGSTIYSSISNYHWPGANFYSPCLIKTTTSGSEISYNDLIGNTTFGKASTISKLSDSILFIGTGYQKPAGQNKLSVLKTDTTGSILKEKILNNSEFVPNDAIFTHDKKYLITAQDYINYNIFYLWKLNKNLEYDSIYTKPRVYDSLCPHPITSSTIYSTCDLATSVREPAFNTERVKMHLFPNPASTVLHVEMPECIQKNSKTEHLNVTTILHKWNKELQLRVFDFMGRQEFYKSVKPQEKEVILDVSSWQSGMYFFQLLYGDTVVAEAKGIVN